MKLFLYLKMKTNHDYIIAKEFLAKLPDHLKIKLCKNTLAGVEANKINKKERVRKFMAYLDNK